MRVKTIKRLVILIAVLGLVSGSAVWGWNWQITRMAHAKVLEAENAVKNGDFATAEQIYKYHMELVPDDVEIQVAYADALSMGGSITERAEAIKVYGYVLGKNIARDDVRRKLMELKVKAGRLLNIGLDNGAEYDLKLLLSKESNKNDGELLYWMGRCAEAGQSDALAETYYQGATKADTTPEIKINAYSRLASVRRKRLNKLESADQAIAKMVESNPNNYRVYLERGRYRRVFNLPDAAADLKKALELNDRDPVVYLEMANAVYPAMAPEMAGAAATEERQQDVAARQNHARQILEDGLKRNPTSAALYQHLASLELRSNLADKAIATLERGLRSLAETREIPARGLKTPDEALDKNALLANLASVLAETGETGRLLLRIEELRKVGFQPFYVDFLTAHYNMNIRDYRKARQILVPIDTREGFPAEFSARVKNLLAICYGQLGETGKQEEALRAARTLDPKNQRAKQGLIESKVKQGNFEGAIAEYRSLGKTTPAAGLTLAQLLILRNRQRPKALRDWREASALIDNALKGPPELSQKALRLRAEMFIAQESPAQAKDALNQARLQFPKNVDLWIAFAEFLTAQKQVDEAKEILEEARSKFPTSVAVWVAYAELLATQKQFEEAYASLDQAQKVLGGDRVDLRLERAKVSIAEGGPQVVAKLNALGQDIDAFNKDDRARILNLIASYLEQLQDFPGATRFWSVLAEQEPNNLDVRRRLLDVATQSSNVAEIENNIRKIKEIEGNDDSVGRYCEINYLIWQAQRANDKDPQEARRLLTKARGDLNDLDARHPDWPLVYLTMAKIEQQELLQPGLKEDETRAKDENIIRLYLKAIDLGDHRRDVLRYAVQLLSKKKRGIEAIDLINKVSPESQLGAELTQLANQLALGNRDFKGAEEIAKKAVIANPNDFTNHFLLAQDLLRSGKQEEAQAVLRKAVERAPTDPNRWFTLVQFLVTTHQPEKAASAINEAEKNLPPDRAPEALARCWELMAGNFGAADEKVATWIANARQWFQKAQAAKPNDISIARRLTDFYLATGSVREAEAQLDAILKRDAAASDQIKAWARRAKALIWASSPDPQRVRSALTVIEPPRQDNSTAGTGQKALEDPDDLRVLAVVLTKQNTDQDRKRAIDTYKLLVSKNVAKPDDRVRLAELYEISGNWDQAREEYLALNATLRTARDLETLTLRPKYLLTFAAKSLLRHRKAGREQSLSDAQDVINELKQFQFADTIPILEIQVELCGARNQFDEAVKLIRAAADQPDLAPATLQRLAALAERANNLDLAEQINKKYAGLSKSPEAKLPLVVFLAKHDKLQEAIDICEQLFANPPDRELVASMCINAVNNSSKYDQAALERAAAWLDKAREFAEAQKWNSASSVLCALGSIRERLGRFPDAEVMYKRAIDQGNQADKRNTAAAYNNLAWLMVLRDGAVAKQALEYIDRAIALNGPSRDYLDTRAVIYMALGQPEKAITELEEVIKADPQPAELFHLAQAYLQVNKQQKAKEDLQAAKEKGLPLGLHELEKPAYKKILETLGPL
jgi:tetratricopeptide (TPR) repeat protein